VTGSSTVFRALEEYRLEFSTVPRFWVPKAQ
jgi:hypothetical protein